MKKRFSHQAAAAVVYGAGLMLASAGAGLFICAWTGPAGGIGAGLLVAGAGLILEAIIP